MVAQQHDDELAAEFAQQVANGYARARGEIVPFPQHAPEAAADDDHLELVPDDPTVPARTLTLSGVRYAVPPARAGAMELLGWYNARIAAALKARDESRDERELLERAKRVQLLEEGWIRLFVPDLPTGALLAVTERERQLVTRFVNEAIQHDQREVADALPKP